MPNFVVTTLEDQAFDGTETVDNPDEGGLSLREALGLLNAAADDPTSTITFADGLTGTLTLTQGELLIDRSVTIDGTGITIDGNSDEILQITGQRDVTLEGLRLTNAYALDSLGASIYADGGTLTLRDASVTNSVSGGTTGAQGGIYTAGDLTLIGTTLSNLSMTSADTGTLLRGGGAAYVRGDLVMVDSDITSNLTAESDSSSFTDLKGGAIYVRGNADITGGTMSGNTVTSEYSDAMGGALYVRGNLTMTDTVVSGNQASAFDTAEGGGIASGGTIDLADVTVTNNTALASELGGDASGGGLSATGALTMIGGSLSNNSATGTGDSRVFGGGATLAAGGTFVGVTIDANEAIVTTPTAGSSARGGAISGTATTVGSTLSNNVAFAGQDAENSYGGAVHGGGTFTNTTFVGNSASFGGAVFANEAAELLNSTVTGNIAHEFGGGFFIDDGQSLNISNSIILANAQREDAAGDEVFARAGAQVTDLGGNVLGTDAANALGGSPSTDTTVADDAQNVFAETNEVEVGGDTFDFGVLDDNGGTVQTVLIAASGAAVDRGLLQNLPEDTQDLDDDGNVSEDLPVDARGAIRVADATGVDAPDAGAVEVAAITVTTLDDSAINDFGGGTLQEELADGGGLSLREAVALANASTGDITINFDATLAGGTIFVGTLGEMVLEQNITIDGDADGDAPTAAGALDADDIRISGNSAENVLGTGGRIFRLADVDANDTASFALENLTLSDASVRGFTLPGPPGGAVLVEGSDALSVTNTTFSNNRAQSDGGAIAAFGSELTISDSVFSGNFARLDGGALFLRNDATATVTSSRFEMNNAGDNGGAIAGDEVELTIADSTFDENGSGDSGGALFLDETTLHLSESEFLSNDSGTNTQGDGGALALLRGAVATVSDTDFIDNGSRDNGGVVNAIDSTVTLAGGEFRENSAGGSGGVVYSDYSDVTVSDALFRGNSSFSDGGALRIYGATTASITDSRFEMNQAEYGAGGAVYFAYGELEISGSLFDENEAYYGGGALDVSGITSITQSTFTNNIGYYYGGAIQTTGVLGVPSALDVEDSTFAGNVTTGSGGAIYVFGVSSSVPVTLTNTTVANNYAGDNGGGIGATGRNPLTLTNTTVTSNYAGATGGGIANVSGGATNRIEDSIVSGNGSGRSNDDVNISGGSAANVFQNSIIGTNLYDGSGTTTSLGGDTATTAAAIFEDTQDFVDLDGDGVQAGTYEVSLGNNVAGGVLADNGGQLVTVAIAPDGPAINAGDETLVDAVNDARGANFMRSVAGQVDLGAYEEQAPSVDLALTVTTGDDELDDVNNTGTISIENFGGADDLSLREAIAIANSNRGETTITFANGLAGETIDISGLGTLVLTQSIAIDGDTEGDGAQDITVSGGDAVRVFEVSDTGATDTIAVTFEGLAITGGDTGTTGSDLSGGGINASGDIDLTLQNVTVTGNTAASDGGGVFAYGAEVTIVDTVFSENTAGSEGGGLYVGGYFSPSSVSISGSTFENNEALGNASGDEGGGGLYVIGASTVSIVDTVVSGNESATFGGGATFSGVDAVDVQQSAFIDNETTGSGGGLAAFGFNATEDSLTMSDTVVEGNTAVDGAGVWLFQVEANLEDSTIARNDASGDGGGIFAVQNTGIAIDLTNVTLADNTAAANGGAIDLDGVAGAGSGAGNALSVLNSTATSNFAGESGGGFYLNDAAGPITIQNSIVSGNAAAADNDIQASATPDTIYSVVGTEFTDGFGNALALASSQDEVSTLLFAETKDFVDLDGDGVKSGAEEDLGLLGGVLSDNGGTVETVAINAVGPAVNAGDGTLITEAYDARGAGYARTVGRETDLGAYEAQNISSALTLTVTTLDDELDDLANDGTVSVANFGGANDLSLREAIALVNAEAEAADTRIVFRDGIGTELILTEGTLALASSVTIDGSAIDGLTINGDAAFNHFTIDALSADSAFQIANLTLDNGYTAGFGGAVAAYGFDGATTDVTLEALTITGSQAGEKGGGIYADANTALSVVDSEISGNTADLSNGSSTSGGGVFAGGTVAITGSTISENSAFEAGGGVYAAGAATVTNSTISFNSLDGGTAAVDAVGGGIATKSGLFIEDSVVEGNEVGSNSSANGGGIYNTGGEMTIVRTTVRNNVIDGAGSLLAYGGGVAHRSSDALTIVNSTVSRNQVLDSGIFGVGGGVFSTGPTTLINTTVFANTLDGGQNLAGGGVALQQDLLTLINTTVTENGVEGATGISAGGGISAIDLSIANSIIAGNGADNPTDNAEVLINAVNRSVTNNGGNVLSTEASNAIGTTDNVIEDDLSNIFKTGFFGEVGLEENGGPVETVALSDDSVAIDAGLDGNLPDDDFDLDDDSVTDEPLPVDARGFDRTSANAPDAGAFEAQFFDLVVTTLEDQAFGGGTVAEELAETDGLSLREAIAIANTVSGGTITFAENLSGGTIFIGGLGELVLTSNITIDGDADNDGEALDADDIRISADTADGADDAAGRIFRLGEADNTVVTFTLQNLALTDGAQTGTSEENRGGAILVDEGDALTLTNATVADNTAEGDAGAIAGRSVSLAISDSVFLGNAAGDDGGALLLRGSSVVTISDTLFKGNTADEDAGVIDINAGELLISGSEFLDNYSADDGAAIKADDTQLTISETLFRGNVAEGRGGALDLGGSSGSTTITSSRFEANEAESTGGAINTSFNVPLTVENSVFEGNYTDERGGALSLRGDASISGSSFRNNLSDGVGGAIYAVGSFSSYGVPTNSQVTIDNSTITGNRGDFGGGAFYFGVNPALVELTLINTTVANNYSGADGGAILAYAPTPITLINSTVTSNFAAGNVGGIDNPGDADNNTIVNSIVSGNGSNGVNADVDFGAGDPAAIAQNSIIGTNLYDGAGAATSLGTDTATTSTTIFKDTQNFVDLDGDGIQSGTYEVALGTNVAGGVLADNGGAVETVAITTAGAAFNGGDGTLINAPNDARGVGYARNVGGGVDLGAYEAQGETLAFTVTTLDDELDDENNTGAVSLENFGGADDLSLREAIALANVNPGETTITFADNLTGSTIDISALGTLVITQSTVIDGDIEGDGDQDITVSGGDAVRVFSIEGDGGSSPETIVALEGLVITDGFADGDGTSESGNGGGILATGGVDLTLRNLTVTENTASFDGGGVRVSQTQLTLIDTVISNNTSQFSGGGLSVGTSDRDVSITSSTIANNTSLIAGGLIVDAFGGSVEIVDTVVTGNTATGYVYGLSVGGVVLSDAGEVDITGSTFTDNTAEVGPGGGLTIVYSGDVTLSDTVIEDNTALDGAGLWVAGTDVSVDASTIARNVASGDGGGIFAVEDSGAEITLTNTTLADNIAGGDGGAINLEGVPPLYFGYGTEANSLTLLNSTVTSNFAGGSGGGLVLDDLAANTIQNSIVSGNAEGADGAGNDISTATALNTFAAYSVVGTDFIDGAGNATAIAATQDEASTLLFAETQEFVDTDGDGAQTGSEPSLGLLGGVLADNGGQVETVALRVDGPAINAGDAALVDAAYDARGAGYARTAVGEVDLGAYEAQAIPLSLVVTTAEDQLDDVNNTGALTIENFGGADDLSLREAIALANTNPGETTITFADTLTDAIIDISDLGTLVITQSTVIDGDIEGDGDQDITVSGGDAVRVFLIEGDGGSSPEPIEVALEGLVITGGLASGDDGGGIRSTDDVDLTLRNLTITGNTASYQGGGVSVSETQLTVIDTVISGNTSEFFAGGLDVSTSGRDVSITSSTIADNTALLVGGLIVETGDGSIAIVDTVVTGNTATEYGYGLSAGGAFVGEAGEVEITGSTFADNTAEVGPGGGLAIGYSGDVTISDTVIEGNTATDGAGLWVTGTDVSVDASTIARNVASGDGGGIFVERGDGAAITLTNTTLADNIAGGDGGAINLGGVQGGSSGTEDNSLTLLNSTVTSNFAGGSGGGLVLNDPAANTIQNSIVSGNAEGADGAGNDISATTALNTFAAYSVVGTDFIDGAGNATAIAATQDEASTVLFAQTKDFVDTDGDSAQTGSEPSLGLLGGVLADNGGDVETVAITVDGPAFNTGNSALIDEPTDARGVGYARSVSGEVDLGAYEAQATPLSLTVTTLTDELDDENGNGAVSIENFGGADDLSLREAIAIANTNGGETTINFASDLAGGTIFIGGLGELVLTQNITIDGDADTDGEALDADDIHISADTSDGADDATGRIFRLADADANETVTFTLENLTLTDGNLTVSTAADGGGAILVEGADALVLTNATLADNTSTGSGSGGAIRARSSEITISDSVFENNSAVDFGGALRLTANDGAATITDTTFVNNSSSDSGGAVWVYNADLTVSGSVFQGNASDRQGGGVWADRSEVAISDSTFNGNSAQTDGGALWVSYETTATVADTRFETNSAGGDGGAIRTTADRLDIARSVFEGNTAGSNGGAVAAYGYNYGSGDTRILTIVDSTLTGNRAAIDGGGVSAYAYTGSSNVPPLEVALINTTVANNRAAADGGGIALSQPAPITLINSTVTSNYATGNGGGIHSLDDGGGNSIVNSIVSGNGAGAGIADVDFATGEPAAIVQNSIVGTNLYDGAGSTTSLGTDTATTSAELFLATQDFVDIDGNGIQSGIDEVSLGTNIAGGMLEDNGGLVETVALLQSGAAINAGDNTEVVSATDARGDGFDRIVGPATDLGAFELQNFAPVLSGLDATPTFIEGGSPVALDTDATVSDEELDALNNGDGNYTGATLTLQRSGGAVATDLFGFSFGNSSSISLVGNNFVVGGNAVASLSLVSGVATITFTDAGGTIPTTTIANEILQAATYGSTSTSLAAGDNETATIAYVFDDGSGVTNSTATGSIDVTVSTVFDGRTVVASAGNDSYRQFGSEGTLIAGLDGADFLAGGTGADTVLGGDGSDVLLGSGNDDTLVGGAGTDSLTGGSGNDMFEFRATDDGATQTTDRIADFAAGDTIALYGFTAQSFGALTVTENVGGGTLIALSDKQQIFLEDVPTLSGFENQFVFDTAIPALPSINEALSVLLTDEDDSYRYLGADDVNVFSLAGADFIATNGGADSLAGGAGEDILLASAGVDTLVGGAGADSLTGGSDGDLFRFSASDDGAVLTVDRIADFDDEDQVLLEGFAAQSADQLTFNTGFSAGLIAELSATQWLLFEGITESSNVEDQIIFT